MAQAQAERRGRGRARYDCVIERREADDADLRVRVGGAREHCLCAE